MIKTVRIGIGSTIEYRGTNRIGEHRDPCGPEFGAVGETEVGDGLFAKCTANGIHVASRGLGGNVLEHLTVVLHTEVDELLREVDHFLLGSSIVGWGINAEESVIILRTVHCRCGFAGAAWIPTDNIKPVGEL